MAKKAKRQTKKQPELQEGVLPQNILPMGERVEENKNIYISQSVYKQIQKFTKNKTTNESGGMLVGTVVQEFGKTNIVISGFVEAKFCEATPTTLKFTHETWDYVHKEIDKKYSNQKIVGWIHTHPDFGIFLSEYDKFIHQNFFSEDHQVAYVVDPIQKLEGFYFWINSNLERCKGFYIYDKTGVRITVDPEKDEPEAQQEEESIFSIRNILLAILSVAVIFLIFSNISLNNTLERQKDEIADLETQQIMLAESANMTLAQMEQIINNQAEQLRIHQQALIEAGLVSIMEQEPETPQEPATEDPTTQEPTSDTTETTEGEADGNA